MAVCMSICRALLLVGGLGSTARTQTVRASLVDRESGAPIVSAMVSLRDSADRAIDLGLTDKRGHVRLASRTPGQFTLAIQRIGGAEERSPSFELDSAAILWYEHRLGAITPVDSARVAARTASRLVRHDTESPSATIEVVIRTAEDLPLGDVQLMVADDSGTVRVARRTGPDGRLRFARADAARARLITVRRLGWQPAAMPLESAAIGRIDTLVATLVPAAEVLTAVSIRAGHPLQRYFGLNPRGITGRVLWPDQVEGLSPSAQLPDIVRAVGMASVIAYPIGNFGEYCYAMRYGLGGPRCMPIYLDGRRVNQSVAIDYSMVHSVAILRPIDTTILFGVDAPDGAILVFTTAVWGDRVRARR
jgi:hypothetical protein